MILVIALFGVFVISAVAVAQEACASGGLMSLVAHCAQDVYKSQTNDDDSWFDGPWAWQRHKTTLMLLLS
ncbi:MAG: hypothetical protein M3044_09815 [Thermoproteota archaeon]|nr:hypothetical protein [Thermoproteota archaeon]